MPTDERTGPRFPLLLTTGRILSQYNVGAQTRRTDNVVWHEEDVLEIHPHDAEQRGIRDGDWVAAREPRRRDRRCARVITERVAPGVVYTTFHHPTTQANVVTTDYSDWATNCPEYKVTAVQVIAVQRADATGRRNTTRFARRAAASRPPRPRSEAVARRRSRSRPVPRLARRDGVASRRARDSGGDGGRAHL